ncbi:MAG: MoaD/ThiS family protein [Cytophagales bacterium]|jgi:molybdopterin converting factor subunit 1|nr:MoaD/ThiS family protein [Cytophagales bacterium]MCA6389030.1 MoaD/ThiS family protein [Cytophagales bacterium]MCA6392855.1 MoaD/ThiS family protein [Cytophagales bacterium]MCA6394448.1 MoaD/ThiS family protein [Cytophagales bacterium]MCA6397209.1 MoaD/ThiS family protein [Cytophagales bacterium]
MNIKVKAFGICKDILGAREVALEFDGELVEDLRKELACKFPDVEKLNSLLIAVNEAYAEDDLVLKESDTVALIPPVSGG